MRLEITNLQVSQQVMGLSDQVTITYTVVNNTGKKVTVLDMGVLGGGTVVWLETDKAVSIANGGTKAFTYQFQPDTVMKNYFVKHPDVHVLTLQLYVSTYYSDGTAVSEQADALKLYDGSYAISIDSFEAVRCLEGVPNDEGEHALMDLKITLDEAEGMEYCSMLLYYAEGDLADESSAMVDLTAHIADAQAGLTAAQILTQTFDNGSDWAFLLVLSNGLESVRARISLAKAFANVHLSGATTGGVAFGKFSASEEGSPLFECAYPAQMLGGIEGVNRYSTEEVLTGGVWIDGKPLYRKLLVITSTATGTWNYDISDLNHDYIRVVSDMIRYKYNNNAYIYWAQGGFYSGEENYHRVFVRDSALRIGTGTYIHRQVEYVLLEYTKAD